MCVLELGRQFVTFSPQFVPSLSDSVFVGSVLYGRPLLDRSSNAQFVWMIQMSCVVVVYNYHFYYYSKHSLLISCSSPSLGRLRVQKLATALFALLSARTTVCQTVLPKHTALIVILVLSCQDFSHFRKDATKAAKVKISRCLVSLSSVFDCD